MTGVVKQPPGRKAPRPARRPATRRFLGRMRRRAARGFLGRIRLGTAAASPRLRRWALALVLLGVVLAPYPSPGAADGTPASACRAGCRAGSVPSMIAWTKPLPGSWSVVSGLTGTVPTSGLAYVAAGYGVAAVGTGLAVYGYSAKSGRALWRRTLTGFPAGAAIVSVRTWPGEVTAGVSYSSAGHLERSEVAISGSTGTQWGRYPAAEFGGAVAGSRLYTVIVGTTSVTSYDNATGRVRWRQPIGQVPQAWRTDGGSLYVADSAGGLLGSAPITTLRKIDLATGAQYVVPPLVGLSFTGTLSAAFDGVAMFSSAGGVTAYDGTTGAWLWSMPGAVPEGTDPGKHRIYLTKGSNLIGVDPLTGRVTATASGSAVNGSAGIYVVRDGVALGLDQGAGGDAWGYNIGAQRVTLAAAGLPWPHYFVDLSGVGGSAAPASDLVVIAACGALAPSTPAPPSPSATPTTTPGSTPTTTPGSTPTTTPAVTPTTTPGSTPTTTPGSTPTTTPAVTQASDAASAPTQTATRQASPNSPTAVGSSVSSAAAASTTVSPDVSPSASSTAGQGCLRPELVALNL